MISSPGSDLGRVSGIATLQDPVSSISPGSNVFQRSSSEAFYRKTRKRCGFCSVPVYVTKKRQFEVDYVGMSIPFLEGSFRIPCLEPWPTWRRWTPLPNVVAMVYPKCDPRPLRHVWTSRATYAPRVRFVVHLLVEFGRREFFVRTVTVVVVCRIMSVVVYSSCWSPRFFCPSSNGLVVPPMQRIPLSGESCQDRPANAATDRPFRHERASSRAGSPSR